MQGQAAFILRVEMFFSVPGRRFLRKVGALRAQNKQNYNLEDHSGLFADVLLGSASKTYSRGPGFKSGSCRAVLTTLPAQRLPFLKMLGSAM